MSVVSIVIMLGLFAFLAILMRLRRMGMLPGMEYVGAKAKSSKWSNKVSRRAESLILLVAATAIFAFTATNTSTGGRLLTLDQYKFGWAVTNVAVAVVIGLAILVGVFVAAKGRTSVGTIIAIVALCGYGMVLNGPHELLESLAPEGSAVPPSTLIFRMGQTDAADAELWVNGVRLGTLPYETTFDEFYAKVPHWAEEPNEMKRENRETWLVIPHYSWPGSGSASYEKPWAKIRLPKETVHWDERHSTPRKSEEERTYYARVKLGDEWGYSTGGAGSSSGGGGRYNQRRAEVHFGYIFPERQKRIEKLLDVARAQDYQPGVDWFEAAETYNSDGWIAVGDAIETEPEMRRLLDAWARWRYDLDEVSSAKSAWAKFEQICEEADRRQYYLTSGVAGRAVELLAARLDGEQLVDRAVKLIRRTERFGWWAWEIDGRTEFGYTELSRGLHTGAGGYMGNWSGGGRKDVRISGYVVAHAVRQLHELLQAQDPDGWNIVQEKVVTEVVRRHSDNMNLLRIACYIGGPQLERFLLRQSWRMNPEDLPWREQMHVQGHDVNGWLYLLAHLESSGGRKFREEHKRSVFKLADMICERIRPSGPQVKFLFCETGAGSKSLAYEYWPDFCKHVRAYSGIQEPVRIQWEYLIEMEPVSTAEMYVGAWRETETDSGDYSSALRVLDGLPYEKRHAIAEALIEDVEAKGPGKSDGMSSEELVRKIRPYLERGDEDQRQARRILEGIGKKRNGYTHQEVATWLAEGRPWHPLVEVLAGQSDPELRALMMGAVVSHPTPGNRKILGRLLEDADDGVREAAEGARAKVEELKNMSPAELAHLGRR